VAGIDRWKISPETRAKFEAILDEAPRLGIDRDQAAAGGLPGLRALIALKQVAEAGTARAKKRAVADAQSALASLAHRKKTKLVNQVQARLLALQGRGSDTEIAHVARGEMVVPEDLQSNAVLAALAQEAANRGIPLGMLQIGNAQSRINPVTGTAEFGVLDWLKQKIGIGDGPADPVPANTYNPADVNDPKTEPPTYGQFNFDPNGPGIVGTILRHPLSAYRAFTDAEAAEKDAAAKYGGDNPGRHNGEEDAYRHAQWNRRMTQSLGPDVAKAFSDARERWKVDPEGERLMDLYNNQVGRANLTPEEALKRLRRSPFEK
jgi:hypothetical protein